MADVMCGGRRRGDKQPCGKPASPFSEPPRCHLHGSFTPAMVAKAEKRYRDYCLGLLEPLDPPVVRRMKIAAFGKSALRRERRRLKRAGVDLAEFDQQQARIARQHEQERAAKRARLEAEGKLAAYDKQNRDIRRRLDPTARQTDPQPAQEPRSEPSGPPADSEPRRTHRAQDDEQGEFLLYDRKPDPPRRRRRQESAGQPEELPGGGRVQPEVKPISPEEFERSKWTHTPSGVAVGEPIYYDDGFGDLFDGL